MSWEAANVPRQPRSEDGGIGTAHEPAKKRGETVEAVLSRLSKAYSFAMECMGAMHAANAEVLQRKASGVVDEEASKSLKTIANATRSTLEKTLLLDPLIVAHSPTLRRTIQQFADRDDRGSVGNDRWKSLSIARSHPPEISSKSHRATIRKLAYLSLSNYADLLQSVCSCPGSSSYPRSEPEPGKRSVLDRGVVKKLQAFNIHADTWGCCWGDETDEDTQRLALVALCDASALDPSDPTCWLKLACAARALGRIMTRSTDGSNAAVLNPYRRLERHALENGFTSLPPTVPPNRAVVRALEAFIKEEFPHSYPDTLARSEERIELKFNVTRYSWSTLGRTLIKACREGSGAEAYIGQQAARGQSISERHSRRMLPFGSPVVSLSMSPMLRLPSNVLSLLLSFLDNDSTWKIEATCRALSVSIMSVRARREKQDHVKAKRRNSILAGEMEQRQVEVEITELRVDEAVQAHVQEAQNEQEHTEEGTLPAGEEPTRANRTSKRVRSQQITSGKLEERLRKRKSVDFCLTAATLSCTTDDASYLAALRKPMSWDQLNGTSWLLPSNKNSGDTPSKAKVCGGEKSQERGEALERIGSCSLFAFLESSNVQNTYPIELVRKYLGHVALNVEEVFSVDPGDNVILTSCLMGCFDLLVHRKFQDAITPDFFGYERDLSAGSVGGLLELLALDLLHAELRFKRCERTNHGNVSLDDDGNFVSCIMPSLFDALEYLEESLSGRQSKWESFERSFVRLKTRVYWLASGVFLWRSRRSNNVCDSREAEEQGIKYIDATIDCLGLPLKTPIVKLLTPHLESPGRIGDHWKVLSNETLSNFRDEVQASSVVSLAQQRFQTSMAEIGARKDATEEKNLLEDDAQALSIIGEELFGRYNVPFGDPDCKHKELYDDFLLMYGEELLSERLDRGTPEDKLAKLDKLVPSVIVEPKDVADFSDPSILTILVSCLQVNPQNRVRVAILLMRLVLTAFDQHNFPCLMSSENMPTQGEGENDPIANFSDSDGDSHSDNGTVHSRNPRTDAHNSARKCGRFIKFLLEKIHQIFVLMLLEEQVEILRSDELVSLVHYGHAFCSQWFDYFAQKPSVADELLDLQVFRSIRSVANVFNHLDSGNALAFFKRLYLRGMVRITVSQRTSFSALARVQGTVRASRTVRQRMCIKRAEFLGEVLCELGHVLSRNLFGLEDLRLKRSALFEDISRSEHDSSTSSSRDQSSPPELSAFCDSLLWFWRYCGVKNASDASSSFDRPIANQLRVPVAIAVISLCGSASCSRILNQPGVETPTDDPLCLTEFLDSDASAHDWLSDSEDDLAASKKDMQRELLRSICHTVHCISGVFGKIDEKEAVTFSNSKFYLTKHGPLLPLVVTRVLNHVADVTLREFADDEESNNKEWKGVWADQYPSTTQLIGSLLDSSLYKAYRCLFGFVLVGSDSYSTKEQSTPSIVDNEKRTSFIPESEDAACQLYRCIRRAYSHARKSPPKAALEAVSAALPPMHETEKSRKLRDFIFSANSDYFSLDDIVTVVTKASRWEELFSGVSGWLEGDEAQKQMSDHHGSNKVIDDDVTRVHKGIYAQLAEGQVPVHSSSETSATEDERLVAARFEEELAKKFNAILDNLCFGDSSDFGGWCRAAECLSFKADHIADRLGLSKGFARNSAFYVPEEMPPTGSNRVSKFALEEEQEREESRRGIGWVELFGDDLSIYIHHSWSCFQSLFSCSEVLSSVDYGQDDDSARYKAQVQKDIEHMRQKDDFIRWQTALGGLYVCALKKIAVRCLCVALYLLQRRDYLTSEESDEIADMYEAVGVAFYSDMLASQNYGFPMHVMSDQQKRRLAKTAMACFQRSVDTSGSPAAQDGDQQPETWDLLFMMGKCHEKIAGTYKREAFVEAPGSIRMFEHHMRLAFDLYGTSLAEVKGFEKKLGNLVEQAGGSSHGSTEVMYRIHASRLKCLLATTSVNEDDRHSVEQEVLRLTEANWFSPVDPESLKATSSRDRIWNVLADVVAALAQSRLDQPFFHRSVYRHAQALMWAPILSDPIAGRKDGGSLATVPATRSYRLRGLNHATNAAGSALAVINSLFEKKRSQLCAVWVTATAASSPFQSVNNSVRKYDSLRGKYLKAYIEALKLCGRRNELETLLKYASTSKRDLPSIFQASAVIRGGRPAKNHNHDCLLVKNRSIASFNFLTSLKRQANSAMAAVLTRELSSNTSSEKSENHLKLAYACFLRLNCTVDDLKKTHAWKYGRGSMHEVEALSLAYRKLGETMHIEVDPNDWSGSGQKAAVLEAALKKCKLLFPSLQGSYYSKKVTARTKNDSNKADAENDERLQLSGGGAKRKEPDEPEKQERRASFQVQVPEGLSTGSTFTTSVQVGEATKKVKLAVPEGNPSTLRFSLDLSSQHD